MPVNAEWPMASEKKDILLKTIRTPSVDIRILKMSPTSKGRRKNGWLNIVRSIMEVVIIMSEVAHRRAVHFVDGFVC